MPKFVKIVHPDVEGEGETTDIAFKNVWAPKGWVLKDASEAPEVAEEVESDEELPSNYVLYSDVDDDGLNESETDF